MKQIKEPMSMVLLETDGSASAFNQTLCCPLGPCATVPALQEPEPDCWSIPLQHDSSCISSGPKRSKWEAMTAHPTADKAANSEEVASRLSPAALAVATQTKTTFATAESEGGSRHSNPGRPWVAVQWKHTQNNLPNVTKALAKPQFKLWAKNWARTCTSKPHHPPCIHTGPGRFQHFGKRQLNNRAAL